MTAKGICNPCASKLTRLIDAHAFKLYVLAGLRVARGGLQTTSLFLSGTAGSSLNLWGPRTHSRRLPLPPEPPLRGTRPQAGTDGAPCRGHQLWGGSPAATAPPSLPPARCGAVVMATGRAARALLPWARAPLSGSARTADRGTCVRPAGSGAPRPAGGGESGGGGDFQVGLEPRAVLSERLRAGRADGTALVSLRIRTGKLVFV